MVEQSIKVGVIFPSRGMCFSRTADDMLQNLQGFDYEIFFAHGLPIPDCFTEPLTRALKDSTLTHIWFVESDMVLPESTLDALLLMDAPVVTMDYPVSKEGQGATFCDDKGRVIFTGTGCLLVKREVFDKLKKPYFRTDIRWGATNHGSFVRLTANSVTNPSLEGYGLHDVNFGVKLWQAGIPVEIAGSVGQRKLLELGKAGSNDGAHKIEEWHKLKPNFLLKKFKSMPVLDTGKLITVQTIKGELTVHPDKAKKMIKAGMATKMPKQSVVFDLNGVKL